MTYNGRFSCLSFLIAAQLIFTSYNMSSQRSINYQLQAWIHVIVFEPQTNILMKNNMIINQSRNLPLNLGTYQMLVSMGLLVYNYSVLVM
ncbi:hypothetical protein F4806DRAFT_481185 [Annulohypoxylon nitens]|nr:hypothetical protein F4806DRAFT_481185 [Annulohypoxylon nitens]